MSYFGYYGGLRALLAKDDSNTGGSLSDMGMKSSRYQAHHAPTAESLGMKPEHLENIVLRDPLHETIVYMVHLSSQPLLGTDYKKFIDKSSRAVPIAGDNLVVIKGNPDSEYIEWLGSIDMEPKHLVAYGSEDPTQSLADIVLANPHPVQDELARIGKRGILMPFFAGEKESTAASLLGSTMFGSGGDVAVHYFDKGSFKKECEALGIPVVGGKICDVDSQKLRQLERTAKAILHNYPSSDSVLVRGTRGSGGSSAYEADRENVRSILRKMKADGGEILIEPFLDVVTSPNDQWVINDDGIHYLGLSAQLFDKLHHAGNLCGPFFAQKTVDYIKETSLKIVESMAAHGYRGVLGIDYIVTKDGIYPIENNARMNGSTFTIAIVDRIEKQLGERPACWKFFKGIVDEPCSFAELQKKMGSLLYDGSDPNAVFPYDTDDLRDKGEIAIVMTGEDLFNLNHIEQALETLGIHKK